MTGKGTLALFGSGETSSQGRKVHDYLLARLGPPPVSVALLETPAGFQPNADAVYEKVGEFLQKSLQNFRPQISYVRALKRYTAQDPDSHDVVDGLLKARYIFAGPGSPTYAARNLQGTRAVDYLVRAYREGATLALSSAAAMSAGREVVRVYEIFKAGAELGWDTGLSLLDLLGLGIDPIIIPHWNNAEGGAGLDTSRCYVGAERLERMLEMLPTRPPVLGIDEHTACIFEQGSSDALVMGAGGATIIQAGQTIVIPAGSTFPLALLKSEVGAA